MGFRGGGVRGTVLGVQGRVRGEYFQVRVGFKGDCVWGLGQTPLRSKSVQKVPSWPKLLQNNSSEQLFL